MLLILCFLSPGKLKIYNMIDSNRKQVLSCAHICFKSLHLITILFPFTEIDIIMLMYFKLYIKRIKMGRQFH